MYCVPGNNKSNGFEEGREGRPVDVFNMIQKRPNTVVHLKVDKKVRKKQIGGESSLLSVGTTVVIRTHLARPSKNQNFVVSHIQRIGCQPEKNYFTRWPIPLVVC